MKLQSVVIPLHLGTNMQFLFDGEMYKVVRVTGPAHNLLGLAFGEAQVRDVVVEALGKAEVSNQPMSAADVLEQVLAGVAEANAECGTDYRVRKIQFVPTDTPVSGIYKTLTKELVRRVVMGGEFTKG